MSSCEFNTGEGELFNPQENVFLFDPLTRLMTPYLERLTIPPYSVSGRVYFDWQNMHDAGVDIGSEGIDEELRRFASFLQGAFSQYPKTVVTHCSGDNIIITSSNQSARQLLNTAHRNRENYNGRGNYVCGPNFPDTLTEEIFYYWQQHPEGRFGLVRPESNNSVLAIDIRHLRSHTESNGVERAERDIRLLTNQLKRHYPGDRTTRVRSDEIWVFSDERGLYLESSMEKFMWGYKGSLKVDWGVGKDVDSAGENLMKRKLRSTTSRAKRLEVGTYSFSAK